MEFQTVLNHCEVVNGIKYTIPQTEEEYLRCFHFYSTYFLPREPMNVALGGQGYCHNSENLKRFMKIIRQNVSVMATDVATGQLVGTRIAGVKEKENTDWNEPSLEKFRSTHSEIVAIILFTFAKYIKDWDHFHDFQNLDRVYYMYTLTTHPNWGGRGLAQQLLAQSLKVAKKVGCDGAQVVATNDASIHIFRKMGMTVLKEVAWDEIEVDGKRPFVNVKSRALVNFFLKFD